MAVLALALPVGAAAAKAATGPRVKACGKLKKKAAKRRCQAQNKANRIAFNQIKDSRFTGRRGDGQYVDHFFCAGGFFETRTSNSYGTGILSGKRWWVGGAVVKRGGNWINAFVGAPGGFEIALMRRDSQWKIGVASLGRILYPGDVTKASAKADCAAR